MSSHYQFDDQLSHGRQLRRCLDQMEESHTSLDDLIAVMQQMLNGDGSQDAHFDEIATAFGFATTAKAHAAWSELLSLQGKFNTDASVSSVKSALAQAFARFG